MALVVRLQAHQDVDGLGLGGFQHLDLLEAARERAIAIEALLHIGERRRADAAQRPRCQRRLQQVAGVHRAARRRPGADQRVDLVDEENRAGLLLERRQHLLHALLEVAAITRAGDQRAEIERVDRRGLQARRHTVLGDAQRQPFRERRLPHPGFADQQRVVLAAPAQHLDHAIELGRAADQRIDLAAPGLGHQLDGVGLERVLGRRRRLVTVGRTGRGRRGMRDRPQQPQPVHALLGEEVGGRRLLFLQQEHQQAAALDLLRARRRRVHHGAFHHAVERHGRFRLHGLGTGHRRVRPPEHVVEIVGELREVDVQRVQRRPGLRVVDERPQQVLERDQVVAPIGRRAERTANRLQGVWRERNGSRTHDRPSSGSGSIETRSGYSCCSASRSAAATFVSATSFV